MSLARPQDRKPSPLLSNNPFRSRVPEGPPGALPLSQSTSRPISTNPFLDATELAGPVGPSATGIAPPKQMSPTKAGATENTTEVLAGLSINERPESPRRGPPPSLTGSLRRPENVPPRASGRGAPSGHRTSLSDEDKRRAQMRQPQTTGEQDVFADQSDANRLRERRSTRRNSESSVRERSGKHLDPAEKEKKRKERREKEKRYGKPKLESRKLDVIDKLDVTSIYGMGLFHHDGPFDACNPHRNRKGARQAPMQAFPKDSRNMALGGSGPNNSRLNLEQIHGTGQEAHIDYNQTAVVDEDAAYLSRPGPVRNEIAHPTDRVEPVHGEESVGLGTSTFLEGAPASRAAIQRRESEFEAQQMNGGNLSRTKSLAQKIRSVRPGGRVTSPEPLATAKSPPATSRSESNVNPFFQDHDREYDRKGAQITFAQEGLKAGRARAPSSPKKSEFGLEKKMTQESVGDGEAKASGGGFLSRVKSLKGGPRKAKAERREAS